MRNSLLVVSALVSAVISLGGIAEAQSWKPLLHQPTFAASNAYLLTDGRVMVQVSSGAGWWALTPDTFGSYRNGNWSKLPSLPSGYAPLYYAGAVLPDGRLAILGGEYNQGQMVWTTKGAIYDPKVNAWKTLAAPFGWSTVGDAQSVILPSGSMMVANCCTAQDAILNPTTLTWSAIGSGKADKNDEEGWTLLPNGKVLTVDVSSRNTNSEIFDPATGKWSSQGSTIALLPDRSSNEIGPAVLRPDGTVLYTGGSGHNSVYNALSGKWTVAPDFPKLSNGQQLDIADGPAALLPNGNVLCMTSPGVYNPGVYFFEWNGTAFKQVPRTPNAPSDTSYYGRMLVLPSGEILLTDGSSDVELYTSSGGPQSSWSPKVTKFPAVVTRGKTFSISGTQLNGLSQGAAYGDDAQSASNYPLVRIQNDATGHVFFCRTHNHSSMGVATGSLVVSTQFDVPAGIDVGASQLEVVANGIASKPIAVTVD